MKIRYIGSGTNPASYQEYPVTGVNSLWQPEQISDVSDARANALVETGVFVYDDDDSVWVSQIASHAAEHDAIGGIVSATDVPAATVARRDATRINFENAALLQGKNTTWLDWSDTPNIAAIVGFGSVPPSSRIRATWSGESFLRRPACSQGDEATRRTGSDAQESAFPVAQRTTVLNGTPVFAEISELFSSPSSKSLRASAYISGVVLPVLLFTLSRLK